MFSRMICKLNLLIFPCDQVVISCQKYHRNDAVIVSVHHIKEHMVLTSPITGDVNLDHLVMLVSATYLYFSAA